MLCCISIMVSGAAAAAGVSAAAVSFGDGRLGRLISGFADAAGMLLGLVGSFAFMLFFSIFAGMQTVNAL